MNFEIQKLTGKIKVNSEIVGTGFLITNNIVVTARHVVHKNRFGEPSEKEIIFIINANEVIGRTLNLIDAYNKNIDVVFIELCNPVLDIDLTKLIKSKKTIIDYTFNSYGFPNESIEGFYFEGVVTSDIYVNNEYDISLKVKEEYFLCSYNGLSGAPICINDFLVGFIIAQETEKNLFGLSFALIENKLPDLSNKIFPIEDKILLNISSKDISQSSKQLDKDFFIDHIKEAYQIAGPRYNELNNIKNTTSKYLEIFSGDYDLSEQIKEKVHELEDLLYRLGQASKSNSDNQTFPFSKNSIEQILEIESCLNILLRNLKDLMKSGVSRKTIQFVEQWDNILDGIPDKLKSIFCKELKIFEKKFGKELYKNKTWIGYMASYSLQFPTYNLESVETLINYIYNLKSYLSDLNINLFFSKALLLKGRGGIGKTHSLCDVVNNKLKNNLPSLIFFGQYFKDKSPEEIILNKLSLNNIDFESLLYKLNIIGDRINKYLLICIDAINETTDKTYWNSYLTSFLEKINKFDHIKLIISCRSLYLDEILNDEIREKFLICEHRGFEGIEEKAISQYYNYYGLSFNYSPNIQKEFTNPLFLKLYCEVISELSIDNPSLTIDSLSLLFQNFFKIQNTKISKKFTDYISPKDNVVFECTSRISVLMKEKNQNFLEWKEVRKVISTYLKNDLKEDGLSTKLIIDELISENILKENILKENSLSFSFDRFFDYLMARNSVYSDNESTISIDIRKYQDNLSIYKGSLELFIILFKEKNNKELINVFKLKDPIYYFLFLSSLSWRKNKDIDSDTILIFENCLNNSEIKGIVEKSIFTLFELSLKDNCLLNAEYLHSYLKVQKIFERDVLLGRHMLKSYKNYYIVDKIINNSLYLDNSNIDYNIIKLWLIVLGWYTSLIDINIRDRSSKSLTNILKYYPESIIYLIEKFEDIDDDYIQERIWGAVYASLILNRNETIIKSVVEEIYIRFAKNRNFPENVIIRDFLRNIAELAKYMNILDYDINLLRPPYKSNIINKLHMPNDKVEEKYKNLFFNCTQSDFGIYTIPHEVESYGFSKNDVGLLVFNEIVNGYYSSEIFTFDRYVDANYGSLRSRDESVERVSKKYQNINLYRILGRIYDNYTYNPKRKDDNHNKIIPDEQGIIFRSIDQSSLPYENIDYEFLGHSMEYDFRMVETLNDIDWFKKEDVDKIPLNLIENELFNEEYLLLNGNFLSEKVKNEFESYPKQSLWLEINSYLVKIDEDSIFNDWVKDKHFMGRWMPTGHESFYEGWIGEYPWSASYVNVLEPCIVDNCNKDEEYNNRSLNFNDINDSDRTPPTDLISTVNIYNNEKDSEFCNSKIGNQFMFPGKIFFKKFNLIWNGQNVYSYNSKPFFIVGSGNDSAIYVNKNLMNDFLKDNQYSIVWTVLGTKDVITKDISDFKGRSEFSMTYKYNKDKVLHNHYLYKVVNPKSSN